ncbi:leucine-rich repeat-containing protein, putative [Pediculus humanus corporis]|uniref:Dynein axonemal assembly factor 1 homolog n=1 Tax=Pediculus humanus subsp. corporis TaxID=121224 RepID=E0VG19_PEDHC|nr:leucine-rich repeat-containing protein, putative [Pediculus humanus corporis]EEB12325.1 leucine-rich repeat-containing protein, putative [Pediculus humanus corporis]
MRISRRWRTQEEEEEERRNPRMTKESLRQLCKEHKLYVTPHLNDVLYLHYKGYSKIENLEEYTGLKCLWLENNGIDKIENLNNQKDLRCLYLHNNLIKTIENLEDCCPLLDSLNLCHNSVTKIQNLSKLQSLHTLHISHNRLKDFSDIEHLKECKELSCVDLQHNWIDDPSIVEILAAMPNLRVLYLIGNPVVKKIPYYRKNLTVKCKNLTYLDDRPVFPKDRAAAEAWEEGGLEAEQICRKKWADEERAKIDASVKGLLALRDREKAKKEQEDLQLQLLGPKLEEEPTSGTDESDGESNISSSSSKENFEGGDSENINSHNGIIFPWNLDDNTNRRSRNEHGEGGKSKDTLIEVEEEEEEEEEIEIINTKNEIKREKIEEIEETEMTYKNINKENLLYKNLIEKTQNILPHDKIESNFDEKPLSEEIEEFLKIEKKEIEEKKFNANDNNDKNIMRNKLIEEFKSPSDSINNMTKLVTNKTIENSNEEFSVTFTKSWNKSEKRLPKILEVPEKEVEQEYESAEESFGFKEIVKEQLDGILENALNIVSNFDVFLGDNENKKDFSNNSTEVIMSNLEQSSDDEYLDFDDDGFENSNLALSEFSKMSDDYSLPREFNDNDTESENNFSINYEKGAETERDNISVNVLKRNVKSSIELQIITENDVEEENKNFTDEI